MASGEQTLPDLILAVSAIQGGTHVALTSPTSQLSAHMSGQMSSHGVPGPGRGRLGLADRVVASWSGRGPPRVLRAG
jgi:hypothetical protein